ncbi:MAG: YcnI family protein, partial [Variovorax sp.]
MTHRTSILPRLALVALFASTAAGAHVTLPPGGAAAGSDYEAAFRVGHACKDAQATTGITVRLPEGFRLSEAQARKGWTLSTSPREVAWRAESPASALPGSERTEFIVRGRLTDTPGPLYFKVLQTCDQGSADWAQLPGAGADKPAFPAARLDVLAPGFA